jgi:signal transduction histidine kinase
VFLDPVRLKQVLYNYLSNALKFTPDDGKITIRASPEGTTQVRIEVTDTGMGISAADLEQLFHEFQQLDSSAAKRHEGTGLGLALTKRLVEAQCGSVGASSVLGEGSCFYALLPKDAAKSKNPTALSARVHLSQTAEHRSRLA